MADDTQEAPARVPPPANPPISRRRLWLIIAAGITIGLAIHIAIILAWSPPESPMQEPPTSSYPTNSQSSLEKLAALPVKGRAPKTDYDRALFGPPWSDDVTVEGGHNGCNTRDDILRRDLGSAQTDNGCTVVSGVLKDPYTGAAVIYRPEPEEWNPVQVDHVVSLSDAWQKGAQGWDELTRRNFANDPINLQTTTAAANQAKGSSDAATWLPPNHAYRCTYGARIVDVKTRYGLWVTADERETLQYLLGEGCDSVGRNVPAPVVQPPPPERQPERRPDPPPDPGRATAICRDGTYSYSQRRSGSCSRHGGVDEWLVDLPA